MENIGLQIINSRCIPFIILREYKLIVNEYLSNYLFTATVSASSLPFVSNGRNRTQIPERIITASNKIIAAI